MMVSWFYRWRHKRLRKRIFRVATRTAKACLLSFYAVLNECPDVPNEESYKLALKCRPGYTEERINSVLETARSERSEPLRFVDVVLAVVTEEMPWEFDSIVGTPLKSRYTFEDGPEPKLEETFITYYEIVASIIPLDI